MRARRSTAGHQGGRRGHLARQLHALRSGIFRPGAENLATARQPVRPEVVTHVLGTICHPCLRAGHRLAVDAAPIEPVSSVKFPDNWENTGNFTHFDPAIRFRGLIREQLQSLTEKFPAQRNWEFLWRNRETKRWNREVEKLMGSCAESFHWYQARSIKRPSSSPPRKCLWLQAFLSPLTFVHVLCYTSNWAMPNRAMLEGALAIQACGRCPSER